MNKDIHSGHRDRLRKRFLDYGFDAFSNVEKLEFILNFTITRSNTNFIAHELIDEYHDLMGVFEAPVTELKKYKGIGQRTVDMLHAMPFILKEYEENTFNGRPTLDTTIKRVDYLKHYFRSAENEMFYILCLDNKDMFCGCKKVSEGSVNYVNIDMRNLVKLALDCKATNIILVHNHPNYYAKESIDDIESTKKIYEALRPFSICVNDHIILNNDSYISLKEKGLF